MLRLEEVLEVLRREETAGHVGSIGCEQPAVETVLRICGQLCGQPCDNMEDPALLARRIFHVDGGRHLVGARTAQGLARWRVARWRTARTKAGNAAPPAADGAYPQRGHAAHEQQQRAAHDAEHPPRNQVAGARGTPRRSGGV